MARISTYIQDTDLQGTDKVLGTDATGQKTRNYDLKSIGKYLNKSGVLAVARQVLYNFQEDVSVPRARGSVSLENGGITTLQGTTTLIMHKLNASSDATDQVVQWGVGKNVIIFNPYKLNDFADYKVLSAVDWTQDNSFMKLTLQHVSGTGDWFDDQTFGFAFYKDAVDLNYTHNQTIASATWTISHNLNKFPSVTVVDSANRQVFCQAEYIDANNLTLTFSAAFKGKAFCN